MPDLADILAAEQASGAVTCGHTCECHGGHICRRAQHAADTPHVGMLEDGGLIQWAAETCGTGAPLTEQAIAEQRVATAHALLAQVDLSVIVEALKAGGYL